MKILFTLLASTLTTMSLQAEMYVLKLGDLKFDETSEALVEDLKLEKSFTPWSIRSGAIVSARTGKSVRVFLSPELEVLNQANFSRSTKVANLIVAFETSDDRPFKGTIDIPTNLVDASTYHSHPFSFDPKQHQPAKPEAFNQVKALHYHTLSKTDYLGKPWFHHQTGEMNLDPDEARRDARERNRSQFSLYTGGRAISDNLALDRQLSLGKESTELTVGIETLKGITVEEIDWKSLLPKEEVPIDPLAMLVPEDQHVLISPSLGAINKIISLLENEGSPLAQSYTVRNPFRTLPHRYKQQLGIDLPPALTMLLPVKSVAITGYDPFFPTGTDLAILMETDQPDTLYKMLDKAINTPQTHLAVVGNAVVLTNSEKQLSRIQQAAAGDLTSLGSLEEYKFFRHRYPIAEKSTGFVFLSDACIRRWGGPHMRIAASRRTQSIAALNHLTASQISMTSQGALLVDNEQLNPYYQFLLGEVTTQHGQVNSSKMGNLHWLKPTIEMDMAKVTQAEAEGYEQWRTGYEEGWAKVFDPIGFSFHIDDTTKELDLTVMPLSVGSEYEDFIGLIGKSVLSREARLSADDHIATLSLAIDKDGPMLTDLNRSMLSMVPSFKTKPLAWLGDSLTLFAENDQRWKQLESKTMDTETLLLNAPLGVRVEHSSKLKLAMFLTAMKTTVDSAAPGSVKWQTKSHGEAKYVVLSSDEMGMPEQLRVCYAVTKSALIITLREDVLKRAMDRENAEHKLELSKIQQHADHLYINADSRFLMGLTSLDGTSFPERRREQSYRAIPILNQWIKINATADESPVEVQQRLFGEDVYCPGGKGYQWNEQDMTMESVVYGHPASPKQVDLDQSLLSPFGQIESAIKFEHDGLRVNLKFSQRQLSK